MNISKVSARTVGASRHIFPRTTGPLTLKRTTQTGPREPTVSKCDKPDRVSEETKEKMLRVVIRFFLLNRC